MEKNDLTYKDTETYYRMVVRMPRDTRVRLFAMSNADAVILEFSIDEIIDKIEGFKQTIEMEHYESAINAINNRRIATLSSNVNNPFLEYYRCKCGETKGRLFYGTICPKCNEEVIWHDASILER